MKQLLILILFSNLIAQNQTTTTVDECLNTIRKYTRNVAVQEVTLNKSNMTLEEKQKTRIPNAKIETAKIIGAMDKDLILDLARKINKASLDGPVLYKKAMIDDEIEVEKEIRNGRRDMLSIDIFNSILKDKMKKNGYGKHAEFLTIPLILKVKVNNISHVMYETKDPISHSLPKRVIQVKVTDIIKGNSITKKGDELEFYYMNFWKNTKKQFKVGQEYLVCLVIKMIENEDHELALVPNTKTDGIYLVKENILIDKTKYFGTETEIEWNTFKSRFLDKYINF